MQLAGCVGKHACIRCILRAGKCEGNPFKCAGKSKSCNRWRVRENMQLMLSAGKTTPIVLVFFFARDWARRQQLHSAWSEQVSLEPVIKVGDFQRELLIVNQSCLVKYLSCI